MYCRNCNKKLEINDRFCKYCGQAVNQEPINPTAQNQQQIVNNNQSAQNQQNIDYNQFNHNQTFQSQQNPILPPTQTQQTFNHQSTQTQPTFTSNSQTHVIPNNQNKKPNTGVILAIIFIIIAILGTPIVASIYMIYHNVQTSPMMKISKTKNKNQKIDSMFKNIKTNQQEIIKSDTLDQAFKVKNLSFSVPQGFKKSSSYESENFSNLSIGNDDFYIRFEQNTIFSYDKESLEDRIKDSLENRLDYYKKINKVNYLEYKKINGQKWLCYNLVAERKARKEETVFLSCMTKFNQDIYKINSRLHLYNFEDNNQAKTQNFQKAIKDILSSLELQ